MDDDDDGKPEFSTRYATQRVNGEPSDRRSEELPKSQVGEIPTLTIREQFSVSRSAEKARRRAAQFSDSEKHTKRQSERNESSAHRWIRLSVYFLLQLATCATIAYKLLGYFRFSTTVSFYVDRRPLDFPTVTVCTSKFLKRSVLCDPSTYPFFKRLCNDTSSFANEYFKVRSQYESEFHSAMVNYTDIVLHCFINGRPCRDTDVKQTRNFITRFGMCFRFFRYNQTYESVESFQDGLNLQLRHSASDFIGIDASDDQHSFVVLIHEHGVIPDLNKDGVFVARGKTTYIGIATSRMQMLETTHHRMCTESWPSSIVDGYEIDLSETLKYSPTVCHKVCSNRRLIEVCNCNTSLTRTFLDQLDSNSVCEESLRDRYCKFKYLSEYQKSGRVPTSLRGICTCPSSCVYFSYRLVISETTWPLDVRQRPSSEDKAIVYIHLDEIALNRMEEAPEISRDLMLAEAMGYLSMFLGYTVLGLLMNLENAIKFFIRPSAAVAFVDDMKWSLEFSRKEGK